MRILGIDPGFERLGIAVLEKEGGKEKVLYSDCFKTSAKIKFEERLTQIGGEMKRIIKKYAPQVLAIETLFLTTNHKTAMRVSEARGVVIYEAGRAGLLVFEASPPEIKVAVAGHGGADKKAVIKMVKMLTNIDESKTSDDEMDAVAVALTAGAHLGK